MQYMALYTGGPQGFAAWAALDAGTRAKREAEGLRAWGAWMETHKNRIAVEGGPLGKTKRVDKSGIKDFTNAVAGYVIVEAASHEEAARLFVNHPHFAIFPGEGVEIMPCNPIPTA